MPQRPLNVLHVSTGDILGGAERIAWDLFQRQRRLGHSVWLAVGRKRSDDSDVFRLPHHRSANPWRRLWWSAFYGLHRVYGKMPGAWYLSRAIPKIAEPAALIDWLRGAENFHYPGTWRLLDLPPRRPDVIHCHNLHGRYFDLRALPWLCRSAPVILSLHDAWLLSGHCAHSFDCERWKSGCGQCPDLSIYPGVLRDNTANNLRRKAAIYAQCRSRKSSRCGGLRLAVPCRWLLDRVQQSVLAPAMIEHRIIPNGVDRSIFRPGDQAAARAAVEIPPDAAVLLFSAFGVKRNPWKDYATMRSAAALAARRMPNRRWLFVALGDSSPSEQVGRAEVRFVPHVADPQVIARYYQAADIYVHAAHVDTFPTSVLEALACGTPVAATAVGGIPEQVDSFATWSSKDAPAAETPAAQSPTGALTPAGDAEAMAAAIVHVMRDDALRRRLGENAAAAARARFDLSRQTNDFLEWYEQIRASGADRVQPAMSQISATSSRV